MVTGTNRLNFQACGLGNLWHQNAPEPASTTAVETGERSGLYGRGRAGNRRPSAPGPVAARCTPLVLPRHLSHRPPPATPGSGTLSLALTAAPAGAAVGKSLLAVRPLRVCDASRN
jgi:hypothetical protein